MNETLGEFFESGELEIFVLIFLFIKRSNE